MGKESRGEESECRVVVVVASVRNGQEGLPEKGQLSQGLKEVREGESHVDGYWRKMLGGGNSKYKVSEARPCLGPMWLQESQTRER